MAKSPTTTSTQTVDIIEHRYASARFCILGTTPQIQNSMSGKSLRELLIPAGKKTQADRAGSLKHDPMAEYRASIYRMPADAETLIGFPAGGMKNAIASAALDLPGAKKTQIGRLSWISAHTLAVWGIPELFMAPVRSADIARTPDVRTRAALPRWAMEVEISYVVPALNPKALAALVSAAGLTIGLGDFRQEKGRGSYGQFRICDPEDADFLAVKAEGGRKAQEKAMEQPQFHDELSAELFQYWQTEVNRRGLRAVEKAAAE